MGGAPPAGFVSLLALLRPHQLNQLHLLELMLPNQPSGIATVGTSLGSKTGSVGRVTSRQLFCRKDLIAMQVGDRNFRRRNEIIVVRLRQPKEIVGELGQLPRSGERLVVDDEGRNHLVVALGHRVVQHERHQRSVHSGSLALENREACAGDLGTALKIEEVSLLAEAVVIADLEVKARYLTPARNLHIV